jgi:hypothetical protein
MGVGPFFLFEHLPLKVFHRGEARELDCSLALAQAGPVQIELLVQHNDSPSAYRDTVKVGRPGFHHIAVFCDYETEVAAYKEMGFEVAMSGEIDAMRYCYVDTTAKLGCMVELIEEHAVKEIFSTIADAAIGWDGREPLRHLQDAH